MLQQLLMLHVVLLLSRLHLAVGGRWVLQADGRGAGGTSARQAQQRHSRQQHQEAWRRTTTGASITLEDTNRNIRTPGGHQQENSEPWKSTTTRTLDDKNWNTRNPGGQQPAHQEPCGGQQQENPEPLRSTKRTLEDKQPEHREPWGPTLSRNIRQPIQGGNNRSRRQQHQQHTGP